MHEFFGAECRMDIKDGQTPMMREGLFKKPWTEDDFLNYHFQL